MRSLAAESEWVKQHLNLFLIGATDLATLCTPSLHD